MTDASQPMRVLWLIKGLGPGGAEHLLLAQARRRDRTTVDGRVGYLLPWKDMLVPDFAAAGIATTCLGARRSWDPTWIAALRRNLMREPVDVVHVHSPLAAIGVRLASRTMPGANRPRIVTTEHNVWSSHARPTRVMNASTARLDDARTAVSVAVLDSMPERLRATTEVVRYGVDVQAVRKARTTRDAMRAELGIPATAVVVGTVANLRRNKAYPDLLAAARRVCDASDQVRFVAVGQGPLEAEIRAEHVRLGLGDRFTLLGYREDATRVMAACDVFCLSSHFEGLPIAMMEALALGLPVVATDVGGIREIVADEREAMLVPPAATDRLAAGLLRMTGDEQLRRRYAKAAADTGTQLDIERAIRRTEAVYTEVCAR